VNGITFTIGDIKGLLTEGGMEASADFYGHRVDWGQDYDSPKYDDVIPNQYFLVLTNYMGRLKQTVLIDRYTGDQIWNQPVTGYRFAYPKREDYLGADPQAPGVYRINLEADLWWARDDVDPHTVTDPFEFEAGTHYETRTLRLEVWLDGPVTFGADGKIASSGNVVVTRQGEYMVGGAWKNGAGILTDAHPDYMWVPYSVLKPNNEEPYANVHVDHEWVERHVMAGVDDPSVDPIPVPTVPVPSTRPSLLPTSTPRPTLTPTFTPAPPPPPEPEPTSTSTSTLTPIPGPPPPEPEPEPLPTETTTPRPRPS
jgi:hypothetical protein